ncbi:SDR family NAD(P)-dependent oxidoreductase [Paraglaciecola aquimarina]|uniref:SDR family NAD(P)-dependent oxidoreductase n=1 Tax=Paraglaciecola algarum TaxID=3050085 RepID=A0ABS9D8T9_9ALTE|nr:SDR family NAD(P)-dependent oxidoreductase [Paraglaciecola sp. G1-23]MCF2948219.1 SDR family NAD(P)-dependent oxidoreductase [Paraglaciecola sp. G1-23]
MFLQSILIIGASSAIAKALANQLQQQPHTQLILVSRTEQILPFDNVLQTTVMDYTQSSIENAVDTIQEAIEAPLSSVYICNGLLHNNTITPEKRLEDISLSSLQDVMLTNAFTPMLWIQKLTPLITHKAPCKLVVFSARVGSISDNRLGGWYSYRASKAALNMLLKNVSIEFKRRAKNVKVISFHPGTTDSQLSKPFQKNVPASKLFTADFVAQKLLDIVDKAEVDGEASFIDWQGNKVEW